MTGTLAISARPVVDATLLAIEEINAQGGLLGRQLEPVIADGRSDSDQFAAEAERYRAQMAGDLPALERLLAEDLVYFHSSTLRDTKAAFLEALRSGAVRYRRMTLGDVTVRVYGGLAIIAGQGVFDVTVNGQDMTLGLQFHSIWARRASGLQFVSWQATRLPAEG
jgi:ketosteroid isomerase-like protein